MIAFDTDQDALEENIEEDRREMKVTATSYKPSVLPVHVTNPAMSLTSSTTVKMTDSEENFSPHKRVDDTDDYTCQEYPLNFLNVESPKLSDSDESEEGEEVENW